MAEKGPFLTSCIIFFLSIGAAIFQILEEENWKSARDTYIQQKENILKNYTCLKREDLEKILEIVSEAAGQGVSITGDVHRNTWDWANSVIFAASIVTTIGYGNVAPKTKGGRIFCILYGLCAIPLCLVWISQLGSFFGDRARRLSGIMLRRGYKVKNVQYTCIALFLLWGLLVHLVIPPFIFMTVEEWTYLEGIYFCFITLTTVGFGDYVAGVNPQITYPTLYRVFVEIWIYMGLAWLSLFFSWNVHMVVKAHKVFKKKRRQWHKQPFDYEESQSEEEKQKEGVHPSVVDIFSFSSENTDDYATVINEIGKTLAAKISRSKSCSDIHETKIRTLQHSPRHKRVISISDVFVHAKADMEKAKKEEQSLKEQERRVEPKPAVGVGTGDEQNKDSCQLDPEDGGIVFAAHPKASTPGESVQHPDGRRTRFTLSKVEENDLLQDKENG
ncbi:potassium channel subfamily K member 5b [Pholidichthys leucotaenia]